MLTFCLTVILLTTFTTLLFSENYPKFQLDGMEGTLGNVENRVFYQDPENNILLIDFKEVSEKLVMVQVIGEEKVVLEDRVGDLADDSIYEVDLNELPIGDYTITLTTVSQESIVNQFTVK